MALVLRISELYEGAFWACSGGFVRIFVVVRFGAQFGGWQFANIELSKYISKSILPKQIS